MTPSPEDLLACLDRQGGHATPGQLAQALGVSLPTLRPLPVPT